METQKVQIPQQQNAYLRQFGVVGFLLLLLLATACGGEPASATSSQEASAEKDPNELGDAPLNDVLGIPITDEVAMKEWEVEQGREIERVTAECMLAAGFEYIPVDSSQTPQAQQLQLEGTREYAETHGLGIASEFANMRMFEAGPSDDPNAEIRQAMSDAERDQYEVALSGSRSDEQEGGLDGDFDGGSGCFNEAYEQVFAKLNVLDAFSAEIDLVFEAFNSDPRMQTIRKDWSRCMSEAGFNFEGPDQMYAQFGALVTEITGSRDSYVDPEKADESVSEIEQNGTVIFVMGGSELSPASQAELDGIGVEERNAAVAGWDCSEVSREVEAEILLEYEQEFVAKNGAQISELVGATE